ncbi:hypothetical protein [Nocardioides sp. AE5]|uniref:hypothetical protein n=1 Tax=Nocardioides sp. AE5 TaxID=2962573 RepID=UPI0028825E8F|nr:hypothetical protein [Nocardioides sp. AE5]MDT0201105.1 hypothetical protein [Nocardioides sp. AE5]
MANAKDLRADPAYQQLIDLARVTGDIDLIKAMEHLGHNSRLDKNFVIYSRTSGVGKAAFKTLGLPPAGITVRQALERAYAYANSRGGRDNEEFADALRRYIGVAEGSTSTEAVPDVNQRRIDYIELRLPTHKLPPLGLDTVRDGVLIVPPHVAVVRHAAWETWTPGATWQNRTHWGGKIPLGLESEGSIRHDVARALAAHDSHELAALAAHPGWEWAASLMPSVSGEPPAGDVPVDSGSVERYGATGGDVGGAPYRRQERQPAPHDEAKVFLRNPDLIDRGTVAHMDMQDLLGDIVESRGLAPLQPLGGDPQFDLAWRDGSSVVVCEIKSLTVDNEVSQLRLGLGQVLSYVYKLDWLRVDKVRAVLVVEREPVDPDWVGICADNGVTLTWAPDFPGLFQSGVPTQQEEGSPGEGPGGGKSRNLHHRVFPYMDHFVQYANDRGPEASPWIVRDRSTALRNERQGRGRALGRRWAPGEWEQVISSSPADER